VCVSGAGDQRSESEQQRFGHVGQQNFASRGNSRGGRDSNRNSGGGGGDAVSRRDQQYYQPNTSDRSRQPRSLAYLIRMAMSSCLLAVTVCTVRLIVWLNFT